MCFRVKDSTQGKSKAPRRESLGTLNSVSLAPPMKRAKLAAGEGYGSTLSTSSPVLDCSRDVHRRMPVPLPKSRFAASSVCRHDQSSQYWSLGHRKDVHPLAPSLLPRACSTLIECTTQQNNPLPNQIYLDEVIDLSDDTDQHDDQPTKSIESESKSHRQ